MSCANPFPNRVAQAFLEYFLEAFALENKSLYLSVRQARRKLQGLENDCPGASWLPVICQNPAVDSLTWNDLIGLREKTKKTEAKDQAKDQIDASLNPQQTPPYPSGSIPLNSSFYLDPTFLKDQIYQELEKPGALVRIKAPREMGKTSLLLRILDYAKHQGYHTVSLNLEQVDRSILKDLNQFLRWLCSSVARHLKLKPQLDDYWDEDFGSKLSCTAYFEDYLLEAIDTPLILALDEVNQVFEHPEIAKDFFPLLRSWYEEAKTLPIWQKLRLVVVHSTEIYVPLQLNQSPFNVGLPIQLSHFSLEAVQQLAQRYGLDWQDNRAAQQLMALVGGHPALVSLALYHLSRGELTLKQLLATAPTGSGIYASHLQRHRARLDTQPELANAFNTVICATEPVELEPFLAYKLNSMGLIKQSGNLAVPSCELYRQSYSRC